jgi:hypothetical protein
MQLMPDFYIVVSLKVVKLLTYLSRSAGHWILYWMRMAKIVSLMKLASKGWQGHRMLNIMMKV